MGIIAAVPGAAVLEALAFIWCCSGCLPCSTASWLDPASSSPVGQAFVMALFAHGWLIVLFSTFMSNHFDLFGLRQV